MNSAKINLIIFFSFFPAYIFRSNFLIDEVFFLILIFIVPILLFNKLFYSIIKTRSKILYFYISILIAFGIDNNIGLWNGIIQPIRFELFKFFQVIYYPAFFFLLTLVFLIYFLLILDKKKIENFILVFLITIFIFNVFDQTKSHKNIKNFDKSLVKNYEVTDVIFVFDEMSGLDSEASYSKSGKVFNENIINFYKKYDFEFYFKSKSITDNTGTSLTTLLNFTEDKNLRNKVLKKSKNYFQEYELKQNLFFEKFNNISVYQNIHIDYCNSPKVSKCTTYSPFKKQKYLTGFNESFFSKHISLWKINGSITSALIWRLMRELDFIDSNLEPEGEKAAINNFFSKIEEDILSKKFNLIFAHLLVPHKPYGYDVNCNYDGRLSIGNIFLSNNESINQHNIERICVVKFLDNFFANLDKKKFLNKINITIMSDHGSRITKENNSHLSTIYAYRDGDTKFKEFKEPINNNTIFINKYK
jgi:hypothetical protein